MHDADLLSVLLDNHHIMSAGPDLLRRLAQAAQRGANASRGGSSSGGRGLPNMPSVNPMARGIGGVLIGTTALAFGAYHSLYTVEGGHRAVMYNKLVGVKVLLWPSSHIVS